MAETGKATSAAESAKKSPPFKEGAKESPEQSKETGTGDKGNVKSPKTQKNQFALNRLVLMLLDLDPAEMAPKTIDKLTKAYALLDVVLKRQSAEESK